MSLRRVAVGSGIPIPDLEPETAPPAPRIARPGIADQLRAAADRLRGQRSGVMTTIGQPQHTGTVYADGEQQTLRMHVPHDRTDVNLPYQDQTGAFGQVLVRGLMHGEVRRVTMPDGRRVEIERARPPAPWGIVNYNSTGLTGGLAAVSAGLANVSTEAGRAGAALDTMALSIPAAAAQGAWELWRTRVRLTADLRAAGGPVFAHPFDADGAMSRCDRCDAEMIIDWRICADSEPRLCSRCCTPGTEIAPARLNRYADCLNGLDPDDPTATIPPVRRRSLELECAGLGLLFGSAFRDREAARSQQRSPAFYDHTVGGRSDYWRGLVRRLARVFLRPSDAQWQARTCAACSTAITTDTRIYLPSELAWCDGCLPTNDRLFSADALHRPDGNWYAHCLVGQDPETANGTLTVLPMSPARRDILALACSRVGLVFGETLAPPYADGLSLHIRPGETGATT